MQRLNLLGSVFALEVHAYAIMSNHFHLVIYTDPSEPDRWTDEMVVERWLTACPPKDYKGDHDRVRAEMLRQRWLNDPESLSKLRSKLGSVSLFMKLLKQPIARRANTEDECTGHFFEQRFYSGALLDDKAIVASMAYVDLNPIRSKITEHLEGCRDTSIEQRLVHSAGRLEEYLAPVISGMREPKRVPITLERYCELLRSYGSPAKRQSISTSQVWTDRLSVVQRRQRAYGSVQAIATWLAARGLAVRERPIV